MPNHKEHCADSLKRYGKSFSELHRWLDEPSFLLGAQHRRYRHDPRVTPAEAKALFGFNADNDCLDHIRLDEIESRKSFSEIRALPIVKFTIQTPNGVWRSESQVVTIVKDSKTEFIGNKLRLSQNYIVKQVTTEEKEENADEDDEWWDEPDNPEAEP